MKLFAWLFGIIAVGLVVVVVGVTLLGAFQSQMSGSGSCSGQGLMEATCAPGANANAVSAAAALLEDHVSGARSNLYNSLDPIVAPVVQFWFRILTCFDPTGLTRVLCPAATSGDLQCVEFVTGAFFMAGDPLPAQDNASGFWPLYKNRAGWTEINATASPPAARGLPQPGDIVVWSGGPFGHVAVVIGVQAPNAATGQDGWVRVAEGNAPGNRVLFDPGYTSSQLYRSNLEGDWYQMPLASDLSVGTWPGYTVLGYIRQNAMNTDQPGTLPPGIPQNNKYVNLAWQDAKNHQIPPTYFVKQINEESGFAPNAVGHDLNPANRGLGIAQFVPAKASELGVNPWDPVASLDAAAGLMSSYANDSYGGDYAKALAAYNTGPGNLQAAMTRCGANWRSCVSPITQKYITDIMGP